MATFISEMRLHNPIFDLINALLGAFLSLIAAYLLTVIYLVKNEIFRSTGSAIGVADLLIGAPVWALVHLFWWVIPVGLIVGFTLPLLVKNKSRRYALIYAILIGVAVGLYFGVLSAHDFATHSLPANEPFYNSRWWERFTWEFVSFSPLMIVYSAIWTCAYALIKTSRSIRS